MVTMGSILRQAICSAIVCILSLSIGLIYTWPSSTLKLFESTNTTLNRPMTETELSLFGSLSSIGALVSTPLAGLFLDSLGRKYCTLVASLMHVIAWSLISFCNKVEVVLTAVFISGLGGVVFLVVPIYIAEFCDESIRGTMSSLTMVIYSIGMLVSYLLGGLLSYYMMIYICLSISVVGVVLLSFMKESPVLLMKKGLEAEAAEAIAFFKDKKLHSKAVQNEMAYLRRILNPDIDDNEEETMKEEEEKKLKPEKETKENLSIWQFFKRSKSTRRAFFVVAMMCSVSFLQGLIVVQVYAEPLFLDAVPNIPPTVCTVILAVVNILAGFAASYFIETAGRRFLMIYSSIPSGVCCLLLGTQFQFQWGPHVLTAVLLYVFCMTYAVGAGTVPYVMIAEVFLPEIRSFASTVLIEYCWLLNFIVLFLYNPLVSAIGLGPVFYIFSAVCFVTPIYCSIWMPETKGLQVDAIQLLFAPKRRKDLP